MQKSCHLLGKVDLHGPVGARLSSDGHSWPNPDWPNGVDGGDVGVVGTLEMVILGCIMRWLDSSKGL